ncbi:MAG: FAD:protein FMN transferase, partial [Candidatus Cloacimonetes bacterium]|nr:FAD:protein FMN transferase [Candidatus Cloacimonadota bacterium]
DKTIGNKIDKVFKYIGDLEKRYNDYDPESWMWKVNNSDEEFFEIDKDAYAMLSIADSLYKMTDGAFDITIKPVFDLWNFTSANPVLPDSILMIEKLELVNFPRLKFTKNGLVKPKGMQMSFGAIAKGYILDQAKEYMQSLGLEKGVIDCRSSMIFYGGKLPQMVYIQHPRKGNEDFVASFRVKDMALSTSGDYQQYFDLDGIRYHHILNPNTGYPVENVYSVTVVHPSAAWADGLSTALFLMNPISAIEKLLTIEGSDAVIYYNQNGETVSLKTQGMKRYNLNETEK